MKRDIGYLAVAALFAAVLSGCASTGQEEPEVTHDGLHLVHDTTFAAVYLKPGVDLSVYEKYGVTDCQVAFRKNWLRDQNTSRMMLTNRVTQKDMDRIKSKLGEDCEEKFRDALLKDPAYTLVEEFTQGEEVLILRPSIINLDVSAPDTNYPGIERSYTTSSGEMTLYLELLDATTEEILARVIDRREDPDDRVMMWTNSVTNKANADRILKRWASQLREGLDRARSMPVTGG
ncbi:DUF3313 family protein [Seongchinamella sediminis]|uniref:DUF3313 family protein n=1 Tax=Seongchinamella sediminis TaxID=2283635 RepID=A0A3L7DUF7_9GAMM|nr:DUF3313 family protein [Seongchinamella sediminis]RLQ20415.1 DUF3313 family protein [Seongchinamella sediminis]